MRLKQKTARRLLLASLIGFAIIVAIGGGIFIRKWQNNSRAEANRAEGMAAAAKADYPVVLEKLLPYLNRKPSDREAWLTFAKARELTEESRGAHLPQAVRAYQRAYALDDTDRATAQKLLTLYNSIGAFPEARDLARKLRPFEEAHFDETLAKAAPEHAPILLEEAKALMGIDAQKNEEIVNKLTKRACELDPANYRAALLRTSVLFDVIKGGRAQAVAFADSLREKSPGDIRFKVLSDFYRFRDEVAKATTDAAKRTEVRKLDASLSSDLGFEKDSAKFKVAPEYTDTDFALQLASIFDAVGQPTKSASVLLDTAKRLKDDTAFRLYARKMWQLRSNTQLLETLADIKPDDATVHSEILAFKALALRDTAIAVQESGKPDDAKPSLESFRALVDALSKRDRSFHARAWTTALNSLLSGVTPGDRLKAMDAALKEHPAEPVFLYFRGEALVSLGRTDEARSSWRSVYSGPPSQFGRTWMLPLLRVSESLLDENRPDEALKAAEDTAKIGGGNVATYFSLWRATASIAESGRGFVNPKLKLEQLSEFMAALPDSAGAMLTELIPGRVALMVRANDNDGAKAAILSVLESKPPASLARRLGAISLREKLGVEQQCLAAAEGKDGQTGQSVFIRARILDQSGKRAEAITLLDQATSAAPEDRRLDYRVAKATFLDEINDAGALPAWRTIADDNPKNVAIQITAIRSNCIVKDPDFLTATIARLVALNASDPDKPSVDVRAARARSLMARIPDAANRDEAVSLLRGLVLESPDIVETRRRLIEALLYETPKVKADIPGAIEQLKAVSSMPAMANDRAPYTLQLARILVRSNRAKEAIAELQTLAQDPNPSVPAAARLAAVDFLLDLRELKIAADALDGLIAPYRKVDAPPPPTGLLIRRAIAADRLRNDAEAKKLFLELAARPLQTIDPDPTDPAFLAIDRESSRELDYESAATIALALRNLGDKDGEKQIRQKLEAPAVPPYRRMLTLAAIAAEAGDTPEAVRSFEGAAQAAPAKLEVWLRYARFNLNQRRFAEAAEVAGRALAQFPKDPDLAIIAEQANVAQRPPEDGLDIEELAKRFEASSDPRTARLGPALREIAKARKEGKLADPAKLVEIAATYPDQPRILVLTTRMLTDLRPPRFDKAAEIITPAFERFTSDTDVAKAALDIYSAQGDWNLALRAAEAWQKLDRSLDADLAVAASHLNLRNGRAALETLKSATIPAAISDETASQPAERLTRQLRTLDIRARANVLNGDISTALTLLRPHFATSPRVRNAIALPIASELVDPATADKWITEIAAASRAIDPDDQFSIANAYVRAAQRPNLPPGPKAEFFKKAIARVEPLIADPAAPARNFITLADIHRAAQNLPAAQAAYRNALKADDKNVIALSGLASLLIRTSPDEAADLAKTATTLAPNAPAGWAILTESQIARADKAAAAGDKSGENTAIALAKDALASLQKLSPAESSSLVTIASAADRFEDFPTAIAAYERILLSPPPGLNGAAFRNNLAYAILRNELRSGKPREAELRRAVTLVKAALDFDKLAPFLDTLGTLHAALREREPARDALRQAFEKDPKSIGTAASLAEQLALGDSSLEKEEARALVRSVRVAMKAGQTLAKAREDSLKAAEKILGL